MVICRLLTPRYLQGMIALCRELREALQGEGDAWIESSRMHTNFLVDSGGMGAGLSVVGMSRERGVLGKRKYNVQELAEMGIV